MTGRSCGTQSRVGHRSGAFLLATALAVAVLAGALIALELIRPAHSVSEALRAAVETAVLAAAVLIARLLREVIESSRQLRDLLVLLAVLALSIADFASWAGPVLAGARTTAFGGAPRLAFELAGALALVTAAFLPSRLSAPPLRGRAGLLTALGLAGVAVATVTVSAVTARASAAAPSGSGAGLAGTSGHLLTAGILGVAGLAFVARSERLDRGGELLAGAAAFLAVAAVQFISAPVVPVSWVTPRDGARMVAFALLLGAAYLRYAGVRRSRSQTAIRSERERVARDLHDGLAQDLACITAQAQRLDCHLDARHPLVLASRDALAQLRTMIADLTASTAATSEEAVQLVARELGGRLDVDVGVRAEADGLGGAESGQELRTRDDLIRSTRDAITRAAAHGDARQFEVVVSRRAGHVSVQVRGADSAPEVPAGGAAQRRRSPGVSRLSGEWSRRARRTRVT
jgi:signal transduction histidine kinase